MSEFLILGITFAIACLIEFISQKWIGKFLTDIGVTKQYRS